MRIMSRSRKLFKLCQILLIVQSASCDWKPNNNVEEPLCKTLECKAKGEEYDKNLNTKADPCQDFYTFTCGNWQANHPGPKYISTWSIVDELTFEFFNTIRKTLESYNFQQGDDITFPQAKLIYEYCVKIPQYPKKEAKGIAREITNIGRVPAIPLWNIHSKYLYLSGESSLFRTKIMASTARDLPVIMLLEPHSAYGSIYHEDVWKSEEKQVYTEFLFRIMKSLDLTETDTIIKERIEKVFQFREKLNVIIEQNKEKKPDPFKAFTGQGLDNWFSETLRQMTSTQKILWGEVIETLFHHVPAELRQVRKIIAMRQKQYFLDLMKLLKTTSEEVLASHMEIYFVEMHLKLKEDMYKLLEATSNEPPRLYTYIRDQYYPRWHICIEELNMKTTLEKLLYQKWFPKDYAVIIHQMISRLKGAFEDQIFYSKWLDQSTRNKISENLKKVEEWIGFPPWLDGDGTPTLRRDSADILTPQATLTLTLNLLYIHAPLLLPPLFSPTIPTVYNYAGMGTTLGHELYHIIDNCGQYAIKNGNFVWWEPAMRDECNKRKALFIGVYNKITDREFKNRYNLRVKSDTSVTFLENFPDVMGLEAAYNAYKHLANNDRSVCQTLPNFEKYSCDQMFYISFANTYCGFNTKRMAERKLIKRSAHSLDSIRINGGVAQMKSFARAFGCPVGTPMNPEEKLDLWE